MTPNRAHAYHKPRGRSALAAKNLSPNSIEHSDLPSSVRAKSIRHEFAIEIPTDYKAVMRKDYFTDSYAIVAPKRHLRPSDFAGSERPLVETASSPRLDLQTEIDSICDRFGNWKTKVVDNKFPALTLDNPEAYGKQEIVIDTPLPNTPMGRLDHAQIVTILQTYQKRMAALFKIKGVKYVTVFKNDGVRAGASLAHSHSQIFAVPIIPPKVARISHSIEQYFQKTGKSPYDSVIAFERTQKVRLIAENEHFISFCPFSSRWPLDAWIVPKKHLTSLVQLDNTELSALAESLRGLICKLTKYHIDYNFYLENGVSPNHRFALKIQSRSLNWWAGFEVASEIAINPIPPEVAAAWYRSKQQ